VTDQTSGHVLEEVEGDEEDTTHHLQEKYGPNVNIVKE